MERASCSLKDVHIEVYRRLDLEGYSKRRTIQNTPHFIGHSDKSSQNVHVQRVSVMAPTNAGDSTTTERNGKILESSESVGYL